MAQPTAQSCDEGDGLWLPLTEFSVRSGISTSTIRRKIKSNSLQYRLENGRYLIWYSGKELGDKAPASPAALPQPVLVAVPAPTPAPKAEPKIEPETEPTAPVRSAPKPQVRPAAEESVFPLVDRAVQMVSGAFEQALREKDERIRLLEKQNQELKDRLNELRILVRALEEKYEVRY